MAAKSEIEWTEYTANPFKVKGGRVWPHGYHCTKVSPGCAHCYAEKLNIMRGTGQPFDDRKVEFYLDLSVFDNLPKNKSVKVFVQSMGDIFHEDIPDDLRAMVFDRIFELAGRHTLLILTKRPQNIVPFIQRNYEDWDSSEDMFKYIPFGVTVESPEYLWRIEELLKIPAAVRFVSLEPMLGGIDIDNYFPPHDWSRFKNKGDGFSYPYTGLQWVIIGAESGPKRREYKLEWVRDVVGQCRAADVPIFVKQLHINGKLSKNMDDWPPDLQVRQWPE